METMEAAFVDQYPYTTDHIANELHMEIGTFRVWKNKMESSGVLIRPKLGGHLCIQDPSSRNRILYSQEYVDRLKEVRERSPKRMRNKEEIYRESSLKNALMKITIPIFDPNIVSFIRNKFNDEAGLESHLKEHINNLAIPALSRIEELKKKHAQELEEMMREF